jgi:hypothetical protein
MLTQPVYPKLRVESLPAGRTKDEKIRRDAGIQRGFGIALK